MLNGTTGGTDRERVKREAAQTTAIASDPNDPTAVTDYWAQSTIKRGHGRPAMPVKHPTLNMQIDADVIQAFKN